MRIRIAAVILKDRKLLLCTKPGAGYWWTPGGGMEKGETNQDCLSRELAEELSVELVSMKPYISYSAPSLVKNEDQIVHCYLAQFNGIIRPANEISEVSWYSRQDDENNLLKVVPSIKKYLIPKLISDNLI